MEHVVHEVTHAIGLGIPLTDGELSQRIEQEIGSRALKRQWDSMQHEALCLASEATSLRLLGLAAAVVAEHNAAQEAGEWVAERRVVDDVEDLLCLEAAAQCVVADYLRLIGSDEAKDIGQKVAAVLRQIGEAGWN